MIKQYRKKPVVIEAVQHTGSNFKEVTGFCPDITGAVLTGKGLTLSVKTPEGTMKASLGDYIIKGVKGEFYPCKPDIFEATYEEVPQ